MYSITLHNNIKSIGNYKRETLNLSNISVVSISINRKCITLGFRKDFEDRINIKIFPIFEFIGIPEREKKWKGEAYLAEEIIIKNFF